MVARETGGKSEALAKSAIRSSKFMVRSSENSEPRTQNPELRTQYFRSRTSHHTYRFLQEQQYQFETGAWHLLHTHDLITLSAGFSTKREAIPDTIHRSHTTMREGGSQ